MQKENVFQVKRWWTWFVNEISWFFWLCCSRAVYKYDFFEFLFKYFFKLDTSYTTVYIIIMSTIWTFFQT